MSATRISPKLATYGEMLIFWCAGCKEMHYVPVNVDRQPSWTCNKNVESPTLSPSLLRSGGRHEGVLCHLFLQDGRIQYLSDSAHELAGQTIDLPDLEDKYLEWFQ